MRVHTNLHAGMPAANIRLGKTLLYVEIAATPEDQARGLMFRNHLPENHGMLFVFDKPQTAGFWMLNTAIPLDLGFFTADGCLQEVQALQPFSTQLISSQRNDILYALEVNRGWFTDNI